MKHIVKQSTKRKNEPENKAKTDNASNLKALEKNLGHRFKNQNLLTQALRHASSTQNRLQSNERLEFLGDRILGMVIAEHLLDRFPKDPEGALGYRFTSLTRAETLTRIAEDIQLGNVIRISGEDKANANMLADAVEALIAALYLDGGLDAAKSFILRHWQTVIQEHPEPTKDAKTRLQEWLQKSGDTLPFYEVTARTGTDHAPQFTVLVTLPDGQSATGSGSSKRAAEQQAAKTMIEKLLPRKELQT